MAPHSSTRVRCRGRSPGSGPAAAAEDEQLEPKHQYHDGGIWWRDLSTKRSSEMRNHARGERENGIGCQKEMGGTSLYS